jgi:hypothetical protein
MNDEGNLESFTNIAGKSATGSELILNYTRGTTASPVKPNINDIMGSLRWVSDFGLVGPEKFSRGGGEVSSITTKVSEADLTGVAGDMIFSVAQTKGASPTEMMRIGANGIIMITGSLFITGAVKSASETFVVMEDTSPPPLENFSGPTRPKSDTHLNEPIISFILGFTGLAVVPLV